MASASASAPASGSVPGVIDDNSSVASDLSTLDFKDNFHNDLLIAIQNIESTGNFAFWAKFRTPSDLSISIDGAPYGKGTETFVNTSVRNTWELDPSQFTIISAKWRNYLLNVYATAAEQMGINTPIRAKLYKMLLYEEGAMFKPHTDTEKIPGMFGTLVISLPSKHTGGEVVMKHCGEKMVYKSSNYQTSCAAWYSGVSHEVLPVTSGYRWVLTYNLAIDKSLPAPSAALRRSELRPLRHCIRLWLTQDKNSRQSPYTYHVLEYEYTEANISYKTLKARDLARVTALREACKGLPVTIFLALIEKMERGPVTANLFGWHNEPDDESDEGGYCIDEVLESSLTVKFLQDLNGQVVPGKMFIKENHLLEPYTFDSLDPDKEDYEGHTGNAVRRSSNPLVFSWCKCHTLSTTRDGLSLVNMSLYFEDPILFMTESVVPIFEKRAAAPSFRFKILSRLMVLMVDGTLPSKEVVELSRVMARMLIVSQDFALLRDAKVISAQEKKKKREPWMMDEDRDLSRLRQVHRELQNAITWETLRNFFLFLHKLGGGMDDLKDQFMTKVIKQADKLRAVELFSMWIPFLQSSIEILKLEKTPLTTPLYQKFFTTLVLAMLKGYLGSEPQGSVNWSMSGVDCWCEDCEHLNAFLAHPTKVSARYSMNKQRRFHFHQKIQAARVACTHVTERNTNPNTMVVTKTSRPEEVRLRDWQKRRDQCAAKFAKFEVEDLKTLLGSDYTRIERLGTIPAQATTSQSPATGEKRVADKAPEVIDLTSD
ncbi:uncharacterized protein B0J16DRAFT_413509 [Fusarium flagelliforme]|uniref:uncharacterized protein n=1 Tax=Fusarium flagelliforme TaxID=2675880 RepID=UPI001E8EA1C8|nr:uncharacterized protein B0J16DRAFT_413509 [Fusarium flagelliforme]KAH7189103.1 hypothetical protein B0J16DRAFT_413509 [Fusarium flagelliforme]